MSVIINASTSQGLVMTSDLSGVLTLQQNGVSLPNGGVAPAFSAYGSATQTFATSTFTKVAYNTKSFDTNTNYDATTNYRFTPTVAGYYQINAVVSFASSGSGASIVSLYKNGSEFIRGGVSILSIGPVINISNLVYANGSTDYFEIYGWQNSGGNLSCGSGGSATPFSACLVRGA
jgi:hypothetical protein